MKSNFGRVRLALTATALLLSLVSGCGSGGGKNAAPNGAAVSPAAATASRGTGKVAFTIHWPAQTAAKSRLLPTASQAIRFNVVEYDAPNNVVVLTKIAARPPADQTTSTVLLDGLPTVLVTIQADAVPNADGTGVVQASALLTVSVEQNKTLDKTITLDSTIKKVQVTAAAPVVIGTDGKFTLNLSDSTNPDSIQAALTATAYNAANEVVLTALDKWVYKSEKPGVATVSTPSDAGTTRSAKGRAAGVGGATATVTAVGGGDSVITITESESQVATQVTASVIGSRPSFWNQALGDAQNSSCSSGPSASGSVVGSFTPVPDGDGSSRVPPVFSGFADSAEDTNGNIAFYGFANSSDKSYGTYLYKKSGEKISHLAGDAGTASPTYGLDGTLYTIEHNDGVGSAHVVAQGARSWDFPGNGPIASYLTLSGDNATLYVDVAGNLTALNAATGQKLWQARTGTSRYASTQYALKPAVSLDNATVYAKTSAGVAAFDAATGSKLWENAASSPLSALTGYVGVGPTGIVYADNTQAVFGSSTFRAINPATGQTLWSQADFAGVVLSRNGTVYGTSQLSFVQALNGATGAVLWTKGTPPPSDSSISYSYYYARMGAGDGTLYVNKNDNFSGGFYSVGSIAALDGADGSTKWVVAPNLYVRPNGGVTQTSGYYELEFVGGDGTVYGLNSAANPTGGPRTLDAIK